MCRLIMAFYGRLSLLDIFKALINSSSAYIFMPLCKFMLQPLISKTN